MAETDLVTFQSPDLHLNKFQQEVKRWSRAINDSIATISAGGGGGGGTSNSFATIAAPAGTSPIADSATDILTLLVDPEFSIVGDSASDNLTFGLNKTSVTVSSTPYTPLATDFILFINTTSIKSINLPSAATRRLFWLKDISGLAATNNITLVRNGADSIEGVAGNKTLNTNFGFWILASDGATNWWLFQVVPGGTNAQIQYNNSGVLNGTSGWTWTGSAWLLATNQESQYRAATNRIYSSAADTLDVEGNVVTNIGKAGDSTIGDSTLRTFYPQTDAKIDLGRSANSFNQLFLASTLAKYKAIATVAGGLPAEYATVDLITQGAAIVATTLYAVPAAGVGTYRIAWVATVTRAASTSSVLGGTNGFQIVYTDADDSVVKTMPGTIVAGIENNANNSTATGTISGCYVVRAKASTNIQYKIDYTSIGATTMQFNLHIILEAL